ncbi:MAG: hypothetical protein M9945_17540 [Aquamicrobium sp.]|uniref:hypothetical protein n=1 Tax=Aquamicrobium sp. TaxID=1872579 RepID=UPI00349F0243|nr:hypothetical protein [Aquamicrobium sp.]
MKHQYVGDINDYRKYALLRALSVGGANRIGVCWMLTPDDGGTDGGKLSYLKQPDRFRHFDPELFDTLAHAAGEPDRRRLQSIEDSGAIAGALYHNETLPQAVDDRATYIAEGRAKFADADLVFFDPDNGIQAPAVKMGHKAALKYVFLDEVAAFYGDGKSVLIYQHFPMMKPKQQFVADTLARLRATMPDAAIFTFTTSFVVFFLLVHPESPARLAISAMEACGQLDPSFVRGEYLGRASLPAG